MTVNILADMLRTAVEMYRSTRELDSKSAAEIAVDALSIVSEEHEMRLAEIELGFEEPSDKQLKEQSDGQ